MKHKYFLNTLSVFLFLLFWNHSIAQIEVSSPTLEASAGPYYGDWITDPLETNGKGLVWKIPEQQGNIVYEYASLNDLKSGNISKVYTLPFYFASTGHVVYDGNLYFNRYGTNVLVKYNLASQSVVYEAPLNGAGYMNTYPYEWGGNSDIDFAVDKNGLWVLYSTSANSGRLVVSKLDTSSLIPTATWYTSSEVKSQMGNAFIVDGVVYCIDSSNQVDQTINYTFDTNTSTGANVSIPFTLSGSAGTPYLTSAHYNPSDRLLYMWNRANLYTYSIKNSCTSDTTAPEVITQNLTVQLDASGNASITADQINNGSSDNCAAATDLSLSLNRTNFTCEDVGSRPSNDYSLNFDGNDYVSIPNSPELQLQGDMTIEAWFKVDGYNADWVRIVGKGNFDNRDYGLWYHPDGTLLFQQYGNGVDVQINKTLNYGEWYHIAGVKSGNVGKLYINGVLVASNTGGTSPSITNEPLTIGYAGFHTYHIGGIDEVRLWNIARTDQEILDNYNKTVPVDSDGLLVYHSMENGSGVTLTDVTGNGHDGALQGFSQASVWVGSTGNLINPNAVTLTVTDTNGNTASATANIAVEDNTAPVAAAKNITVALDANGVASITTDQIDNNSFDACGIASRSLDVTDFDSSDLGDNPVILTITDNHGNVATANATVTITDVTAPSGYAVSIDQAAIDDTNQTAASFTFSGAEVGTTYNYTISSSGGGTNVTGSGTISTATDQISGIDVSGLADGTLSLSVSLTDSSKNTGDDVTDTVLKATNTPPTAVCKNYTAQLGADGTVTITPSDVDGGSTDAEGAVTLSIDNSTFNCSNIGANSVTLTVTDDKGETDTCTATVTVEDKIAPIIACPADIEVDNDPGVNGAVVYFPGSGYYTSTDGGSNLAKIDLGDGNSTIIGSFGFSNTFTLAFTPDNKAWTIANSNQLAEVDLSTGKASLIGSPFTFSSYSIDADSNGQLFVLGTNQNLYKVSAVDGTTELIGNTGLSSVMDIAFDSEDKLWAINSTRTLYSVSTVNGFSKAETSISSGINNEMGLAIDQSDIFYLTEFNSNPRLFKLDPVSGSLTLISTLSLSNPHGGDILNLFSSSDNCSSVTIKQVSGLPSGSEFPIGTTTNTFEVTDASGNKSTCSFDVIVNDIETPSGYSVNIDQAAIDDANQTAVSFTFTGAEVGTTYNYTISSDNGGTDVTGSGTISTATDQISGIDVSGLEDGTLTLSVSLTDSSSNTGDPVTDTVLKATNTPPTAVCKNYTAQLGADGTVTIAPADVDGGSSDAEGTVLLSFDQEYKFQCSDVGTTNDVTLIVTDSDGATDTCTATVTVVDNEAPVVGTKDISVQLDDSGAATITTADVNDGSTDNCGIASVTLDNTAFECGDVAHTSNYSLDLSGSNGIVTAADASSVVSGSGSMTLEAWVYPMVSGYYQNLMGFRNDVDADFYVLQRPDDSVEARFRNSDGTSFMINSGKLNLNEWQHLAIVYDGTSLSLYINGNIESSIPANGSFKVSDAEDFMMGAANRGGDNFYFGGKLEDVRLWDFARSETQINQTLDISISNDPEGLVMNYNLEEGSGAVVSDQSGNSPDGVFTNLDENTTWSENSPTQVLSVVTLKVTDVSGNESLANAIVRVEDNIAPVAKTQDVVVQLDENGFASITPEMIDNGSSDICGEVSLNVDVTEFGCEDAGFKSEGTALDFAEGNNSYFATNTTAAVPIGSQERTISLWVNPDVSKFCWGCLVQQGQGDCTGKMFGLGRNENDKLVFWGGCDDYISNISIPNNTWTYVAVTFKNGLVTLFANDQTESFSKPGINTTASKLFVGRETVNNGASFRDYFDGQIDEVRIYDKALSASEIEEDRAKKDPINGIVSRYSFDESKGVDIADSEGNNNGGLYNFSDENFVEGAYEGKQVTLTVTDKSGNTSTATANVIVLDNINPTAIAQDVTIYLDENGVASTTAEAVNNASSDNCGVASLSLSKTDFDCSNVGSNPVVLTVTDKSGNTSTATANVIVVDNIDPTAIAQDVTIYLDENGMASTTAEAVNNSSSDNCGVASLSLSKTDFDCSNVGSNPVVLTVTDDNANTSTAEATVTVVDNINPSAIAQDVTIYLDENGMASTTAEAVNNASLDNCEIASLSLSKTDFDCSNVGSNPVVLTVTDKSGNISTVTANVTVIDNVNPTAITQEVTIYLDENGVASTTAEAVNNGSSDNCGVASISLSKTDFDCSNVGSNPVVLTVTDDNANTSTAEAHVIVKDNIAPVVKTQDITVQLNENGAASITVDDIDNDSSDACGIDNMTLDVTSFDCSNVGTNTITLTVADKHGNVSTAQATVTVEDKIAPVVITKNIQVELDEFGMVSITPEMIDNGSSDACGVEVLTLDVTEFDCANVGDNTVMLTATDVNGNTASQEATVTVEDTMAPVPVMENLERVTAECMLAEEDMVVPLAVDNCDGEIKVTHDIDFPITTQGTTVITWTYEDVNGNTTTQTQEVLIKDETAPVPDVAELEDIVVQCEVSDIPAPTATDNCAGTVTGTTSDDLSYDEQGEYMITWTYDDGNGNTTTQQQKVIVKDTTAPEVITKDITVYLDPVENVSITAEDVDGGTSDNCSGVTLSIDRDYFDEIGIYEVVLTATDEFGNTAHAVAKVNVEIDGVNADEVHVVPNVLKRESLTRVIVPFRSRIIEVQVLETETNNYKVFKGNNSNEMEINIAPLKGTLLVRIIDENGKVHLKKIIAL